MCDLFLRYLKLFVWNKIELVLNETELYYDEVSQVNLLAFMLLFAYWLARKPR